MVESLPNTGTATLRSPPATLNGNPRGILKQEIEQLIPKTLLLGCALDEVEPDPFFDFVMGLGDLLSSLAENKLHTFTWDLGCCILDDVFFGDYSFMGDQENIENLSLITDALWILAFVHRTWLALSMTLFKVTQTYQFAAMRSKSDRRRSRTTINLLNRIASKREEAEERPIVFVAHSLGGVVVKRALVEAKLDESYQSIREATYGIAFFGKPHQGGNFAKLGDIAASITRSVLGNPSNTFMGALKTDSLFSNTLVEDFRHQLEDYYVLSFFETLPMGRLGLIVDQKSAILGLAGLRERQIAMVQIIPESATGLGKEKTLFTVPFLQDNQFVGREDQGQIIDFLASEDLFFREKIFAISTEEAPMGRTERLFQCSTRFDAGGCTGNSATVHVSSGEDRLPATCVMQSASSDPSRDSNISRRRHSFAAWRVKRENRRTQPDLVWPMKDDASPLEGWDYHDYRIFAPKSSNDVMGSFFLFLRDTLSRFCNRIKEIDFHFQLFNIDARELPKYLSTEESQFDRIEASISTFSESLVSNICDRGYVGPETILSTFGPLPKSKTTNANATLLMLFLNAVAEVYHNSGANGEAQRFKESKELIKKFIPVTPMTFMTMIADGMDTMSSPEMIRISSCYTMFGDFEKAFDTFLKDVRLNKLTEKF
ncbi:Serine active site containing protein 1 [Xylographa parallela]|nr:Serine active site containing protein 1 [Xylographa parallela]